VQNLLKSVKLLTEVYSTFFMDHSVYYMEVGHGLSVSVTLAIFQVNLG